MTKFIAKVSNTTIITPADVMEYDDNGERIYAHRRNGDRLDLVATVKAELVEYAWLREE